jgi:predicted RND superfamily exporter protein
MLQRSSLLEQMRAFKFNIKVFGRTDIKVGQTITYTAPKQREIAKDEIQADPNSEYFTGKYLITAIRHQIIAGQHHMEMEIVSDSFVKDISV